jgi:hypothetical protein
MARNEEKNDWLNLVKRLNEMSNLTPDEERAQLMEAARQEPRILDDNDVTLADIAKLAGIKEYTDEPTVSPKAEKLIESISADNKHESIITKAIQESDADDSISTQITKTVSEDSKRLDKIAELEAQLAELKTEQKDEQTHDSKSFREVVTKDIAEYIKNAEDTQLVELYNSISDNEAVYNEESSSILIKTPDTAEIIADAEQAEAPEEEVVQEKEPETEQQTVEDEDTHETDNSEEQTEYTDELSEGKGEPITEEQFEKLAEKKDACYHKVKARYKVWPSAYASGALVKCRKVGAANWGNKSKK